jgi:glycosyltransferase involved in cell wall biosynthesis
MSEATRLLILDGRLPGDDTAGPLPPLLDRLEHHGFQIQVLCASRAEDLSGDPRVLEARALKRRILRLFAGRLIWSDPRLDRPDLLHALDDQMVDMALSLSEAGQVPYVQTVAGLATVERGLKLSRKWCRRLIVTGSDLADELKHSLGIPHEWIALIPHGVVAGKASTSRTPAVGTIPVIGAGGAQDEGPGLSVFTEAARLVVGAGYDVEFVIACAAREQTTLRHLAKQLGIAERVTVTDYPIAGPDFWSVLDIYCQSALSANAGRMLTLALARARPCIVSDVKGLRTLIDHSKDGLLVPAADPVALKAAITTLLDDPSLARRLGDNARDRARQRFDIDIEADKLAELYREAIAKNIE